MASQQEPGKRRKGQKVRVDFKRNRAQPARKKNWQESLDGDGENDDTMASEKISAKGDLSRKRTIIVPSDSDAADAKLQSGVVIAMRGLYADVDDGQRVWPCVVRRVLRTRLIGERHPVTTGDRVGFTVPTGSGSKSADGVIESVKERRGVLRRRSGKRIHAIAVNIDQAIIVNAATNPTPKVELIDRYIVAAHAGDIEPVVCFNKMDLDEGVGAMLADRYKTLGYRVLATSAVDGIGIDDMRDCLADLSSVVTGQSGVGKSSLLNTVQPGLQLRTADVASHTKKGRHTTTTAELIKLEAGGYVVDTPGIRSFDISMIPANELEAYFIEFVKHVPDCKYANCTHLHETKCAVQAAVERGDILQERYESYVHMFTEPATS